MEMSVETLKELLDEKFEAQKEIIALEFKSQKKETNLQFDATHQRQDEMIAHQKETNGKVKWNITCISELQDIAKEYQQDKKVLRKVWKARPAIALGLIVFLFAAMTLYHSIDLKRTIARKFGVEFVQPVQDTLK